MISRKTPTGPYSYWLHLIVKTKSRFSRYAVSVAMAPLSLAFLYVLQKMDPESHLAIVNILGVLIVIGWGGMGPGLVTAVLTSLGTDFFFIEPVGSVFTSPGGFIQLPLYLVITLMAGGIVAALRRALQKENELKTWAEKRAEADRNVLYVVTHDLKNPLTAISLRASMLLHHFNGELSEEQKELFSGLERSIRQMTRIIDDLYDVGKITAGQFSTNLSICNVDRIVKDAILSFRDAAQAKSIEIHYESEQSLPQIRSDAARILQVISNFLSNAIKFAPRKTRIEIEVATEGSEIRVSVTNSGSGIPPDDVPFIFERHWQAKETQHLGMGLGLYISKTIVQSLKGKIGVQNHFGRGCTFFFSLPLDADAVSA